MGIAFRSRVLHCPHHAGENRRTLRWRLTSAAALLAALAALGLSGAAVGGTPPKRLDQNLGWVLSHPHIHLVAWDNDWDSHNSNFPVLELIKFSKALATNGYFAPAAEYGVGAPDGMLETGIKKPEGGCPGPGCPRHRGEHKRSEGLCERL